MKKVKGLFMLALIVVAMSLNLAGCSHGEHPTNGDHPKAEDTAEHPKGQHEADHPK